MSKETLKQTADKLFTSTSHTVLFGVASCNELFTSENAANNACKKNEKPVKFVKKEKVETKHEQPDQETKTE